MVAAAVQYTQGITVGAAGQALFGVQGTAVVVSNGNNAGPVTRWTFTVLDVPPSSSIPLGVAQTGGTSTWSFTPDSTDSFLIMVTVQDASGNTASDARCFTVKRANTRWIAAFSAMAPALNFASQLRGWAISCEAYFNYVDSLVPLAGVAPAPILFTVGTATVSSGTIIPIGAEVDTLKVRVDTLYSPGSTIAIGQAGSTSLLLAPGDIDIVGCPVGFVFDISSTLLKSWGGTAHPLLATVAGATFGALTVFAKYAVDQS
jgi:hypothetical protein